MKKVFTSILSLFMSFALFLAPVKVNAATGSDLLKVHYIDVGQGDSIYIQYKDYDILIDAGDNNMGDRVVNYLKPLIKGNLELVIATHPDADHIGGMDTVLKSFKANKIIDSGMSGTSITYSDYLKQVNAQVKNGTVYSGDSDMTINISNGVKLDIIETGDNNGSTNNNSVVAKLTYEKIKYLFTGDMEQKVEKKILNRDLKADVLKAGHHGSKTATSPEFLQKVNPKYTIISAGPNNKFGHPHAETINTLNSFNIPYYITKDLGNIIVSTNGTSLSINDDEVNVSPNENDINSSDDTQSEKPENPEDNPTPDSSTNSDIYIKNIDSKSEVVIIENNSDKSIDMSGWYMISTAGNQIFNFPDSFELKAGSTINLISGRGSNSDGVSSLKWSNSYIWSDTYDPGELYDSSNTLISSFGK